MPDAAPRRLTDSPLPASAHPGEAAVRRQARRAVYERMEARAEEQRRSFLRMVSHELRTPLNSILGFSELIAAEIYGPVGAREYKEYATLIRDSGQKLLALANQVLEIARLDSGTADLAAGREPLDHVLDDVLDSLAEVIQSRRAKVVIEGQGTLPDIVADPRGVRTALTALLSNALVHGPEGGKVKISAQNQDGGVTLIMTDQGPGVPPQDIPRLLKPFEQGENALIRRGEGAGLGLPLAYMLCRSMGGGLSLAPGPEGGLKVTIRLAAPAA